jgi:segregation and condensation protein A
MPDDRGEAALSPARPAGGVLWDHWDTPPRVPSAPVLHLDGFDGPIDLLLDLAERQRIDLGRISIVALVEQFVAASAQLAAHVTVEHRADWLVMATRLVLLRSRLLFPTTPEAAEAAGREADREVARLDGLRFIRAAASWLQARPQLGFDVFARAPPGPDPRVASYMALMEACLTMLRGRNEQPDEEAVYRPGLADLFRIPEALLRMRALVATMSEPRPLQDFLPEVPAERRGKTPFVRSAVASTFVAALELCRGAFVGLNQEEDFDTVMVYRPTQQPSNSEWFLQASSAPHPAELPHAPSGP